MAATTIAVMLISGMLWLAWTGYNLVKRTDRHMKWLFLVFSGVLIFMVIGLGFLYPGRVGSPMMIILVVVLGVSAFVIGRRRQGE